ncbi:adenosylcobinamide-phosphate synthase CbiB [Aquabacter spiritensis]|uniref:Cobalamin biosynthesis protein CobD n=1 Tax=Aquabacter spiritensis TaxID=933073 RepID=A0A4R3LMG9_9HYPH|nr:adenosylcobinamide-phosphate synthase CbiB [Aquabacter spiritensis]TCT01573.1 adenosylcobinamide-phosphate synthase [Aquabacter spiritensis]
MPFLPVAALALLIEAAVGYPARLLPRIGHPVIWIGRLIAALDDRLNRPDRSFAARRVRGIAALLVILAAAALPCALLQHVLLALPLGLIGLAILASSLLAQRSLHAHVAAVAQALEDEGLAAGRAAVSQIVGRDPAQLDVAGVSRAAIESLAENFSDGIVAPAFWLAIGGLPGAAAYKAVNTADSMIGHKTPRHQAFGWAAARLDDLVNLPASRLSGLLLVAAARTQPGASAAGAWRAMRRDAPRHRSPNAGWPEAAMAGALGIAIAGPRSYGGVPVDAAFMGDGRREIGPADIRAALRLYRRADALLVGALSLGALATLIAPG